MLLYLFNTLYLHKMLSATITHQLQLLLLNLMVLLCCLADSKGDKISVSITDFPVIGMKRQTNGLVELTQQIVGCSYSRSCIVSAVEPETLL